MNNLDQFERLLITIKNEGYEDKEEDLVGKRVGKNLIDINQLLKAIGEGKEDALDGLSKRELEEIKKEAKKFYDDHFDVHDVRIAVPSDILANVIHTENEEDVKKLLEEMILPGFHSPFDIPITLEEGSSMEGIARKFMFLSEETGTSLTKNFPYTNIVLGNQLTSLSSPTYIHELGHVQTETVYNYAREYHNREFISIFLEKLSALELDPTGKTLRCSEKIRLNDLKKSIASLWSYQNGIYKPNRYQELESSMYIESSLKANKLFDIYLSERKPKKKERILKDINGVFNGEIQVEDILDKYDITISNSQTPLQVQKTLTRIKNK